MKKFQALGSSLDEILKKFPHLDELPDEDPEASQCPYCDGYGHIIDEEGKARPCVCLKKEIILSGIESAHIPTKFKDAALDGFQAETIEQKDTLLRAKVFLKNYSLENPNGLYIYGPTGAGKTHLAVSILKELIALGFDGVFYNVIDLLDAIKSTFTPDSDSIPKGQLTQELNRQVFVLDDFGVQKTSTWVVDRLYALINRRYQDCKTIIITSNLSLKDLRTRAEDRLVSRLYDMCTEIKINAGDYRLRSLRSKGGRGRTSTLR
ncbi:MAG: ATP-binding protein [Candidatus Omnitrophica bacterium]|nr:ATP-binding protein [Candidatus Omnitrophota bacterium]